MVHRSTLRLCLTLFSLLLGMAAPLGALADGADPFSGGAAYSSGGMQLALTTNKGCGPHVTFGIGEGVTIYFRTGVAADLRLSIVKPNGTSVLISNLPVEEPGHIYPYEGFFGAPAGDRTIVLEARRGAATDRVECVVRVGSAPAPQPVKVHLTTDRGCGALYKRGEPLIVEFRVEEDAIVRVVNVRPDGEVILRENFEAKANEVYRLDGNAGVLLGLRTLKLVAVVGSRTGHVECTFTVVEDVPPTPLIKRFETNKGQGNDAVFVEGEPITVFLAVSDRALVRVILIKPNGHQVAGDFFTADANVIYRLDGVAEGPEGTFKLRLEARKDSRTEIQEITYKVVSTPADNSIAVTLSTNRGTGDTAVFHPDELMAIDFTVAANADIRMRIQGDGFSKEIVRDYPVEAGRRYRFVLDVVDKEGMQLIVLDVRSGNRGGQGTAWFKVAR